MLVGYIYSKIMKFDNSERNMIMAVLSSPNSTNIPFTMIEVLAPIFEKMDYGANGIYGMSDAKGRGLLYISLNSIFSNIWRWTVAYNLIMTSETNSNLSTPFISKENKGKQKTIKDILIEILNIPVVVALISLLLCLNTDIKNLFIQPDSVIRDTFFTAHKAISKGYPFAVIFSLGLNIDNILSNNQNINEQTNTIQEQKDDIDYSKIITISLLKLVMIPIVGTPIILLYRRFEIIVDPVLLYITLLPLASPIAINLLIMCNLKQVWEKFVSLLMISTYSISTITLTLSNTLFLFMLSSNI
jgi:predicted permease